jgi:hypothetical protein
MWAESQATIALKKIAQPEDVARTIAFLTSHKASGHITSEYISVDGGIEGRVIFKESQILGEGAQTDPNSAVASETPTLATSLNVPGRRRRMRVCCPSTSVRYQVT